jgi:hypothetical protein
LRGDIRARLLGWRPFPSWETLTDQGAGKRGGGGSSGRHLGLRWLTIVGIGENGHAPTFNLNCREPVRHASFLYPCREITYLIELLTSKSRSGAGNFEAKSFKIEVELGKE